MFLCRRPGDAGLVATATSERINIYRLASSTFTQEEACAFTSSFAETHSGRFDLPTYQLEADVWPSMTRLRSSTHVLPRSWGAQPLTPTWSIPFSQLRKSGSSGSGKEGRGCLPLSLAMSCAGSLLKLFVSASGGGAWIGTEGVFSDLCVASSVAATSLVDKRSCYIGEVEHMTNDGFSVHRDDIVASGWAPRHPALLAVGRRGGIVQLLNFETGDDGSLSHFNPLQERSLQGTITSLDWVPNSHTSVVAALQPDGYGCYVEVIDVRSPERGIRYLGALPGAVSGSALCFAEAIACDESQTYVATAGSSGRRDILQLWDLRMSSRPVSAHVHACLGCTSLCWVSGGTPTVISTTRKGGLWMHSFTNTQGPSRNCTDDDEDGKERRQLFVPSENRQRLHAQVPAVAAVWLPGDPSSGPESAPLDTKARNSVPSASPEWKDAPCGKLREVRHVRGGKHPSLPCLLLLDGVSGELHKQVVLPRRSAVTIVGDMPVWGAGPIVLLFPHEVKGLVDSAEPQDVVPRGQGKTVAHRERNAASAGDLDSLSIHDSEGDSSEVDRFGGGYTNFLGAPASSVRGCGDAARAPSFSTLPVTLKGTSYDPGGMRSFFLLERLRAGFVACLHQIFSVLLKEGNDREAYVLFRYGWYVQRYVNKGGVVAPASYVVPGLLELLQEYDIRVVELILRVAGWCVDPADEASMLQQQDAPASAEVGARPGVFSKQSAPQTLGAVPLQEQNSRPKQQLAEKGDTTFFSTSMSCSSTDCGNEDLLQQSLPLFEDVASPSPNVEPLDSVGATSQEEAIERRATILVCMGYSKEAALLLSCHSGLCPFYASMSLVLEAAAQGRFPAPGSVVVTGCSYWMNLCVEILSMRASTSVSMDSRTGDISRRKGVVGWLHNLSLSVRRFYLEQFRKTFSFMPISDQIAFGAVFLFPCRLQQQQGGFDGDLGNNSEALRVFSEFLHELTLAQFDPSAGLGCSLFLSAAVERLDANCSSVQRYVDVTCDVQTPVLYFSLYGSTKTKCWRLWNEAYRGKLNDGGHSVLRSLHDLACVKMAQSREKAKEAVRKDEGGNPMSLPHSGFDGIAPIAASLVGRHFGAYVGAPASPAIALNDGRVKAKRSTGKGGVILRCKCGYYIPTIPPHAGEGVAEPPVTSLTTGSVEGRSNTLCRTPDCLTPMCTVCSERVLRQNSGYSLEESFTWCTVCLHGGHWSHLREWFAKHRVCPAEDCPCCCYRLLTERCAD
uniref:WGS project CAEQ00000000 data, annotated contig 693 n=1 Tax=Trypanosoma congolense (strain IL3000) TaxID=1068625 RepID=F9WHT3_TRYCI|nr:unnamed protein product [Trypanosoma congolense IL3000]